MTIAPLPFDAGLDEYLKQAQILLNAWSAGDREAIQIFKHKHPRFLNPDIPWLPKRVSDAEIRMAPLDAADAQLAIARWYDFRDWRALAEYVDAVTHEGSSVFHFEAAVEAVISGNVTALRSMLGRHPELVDAHSTRVTHFDPPVHRATLLHYVAANGVEGYRQKTPKNAVDVATILLEAGTDVDALADMYGGQCTTMAMLVSSCHPAQAGVQAALVHTLLDFGAAIEGRGAGRWVSPLMTALVFGYKAAAEALVERGARVDTLALAAGLGRVDDTAKLLATADPECRHRALALAAQLGHVDVARLLLDAGEDPDRYNPDGMHAHATPLHHAVSGDHEAMVRLLVERGARLDIKDKVYEGTPLDWAEYLGRPEIAAYLRARGLP
jgi:hypothetical protein